MIYVQWNFEIDNNDYVGAYWMSDCDTNSDTLVVDIFRDISQPNEYYRAFLNYPPFYSIKSLAILPRRHVDHAVNDIFNIFNFSDRARNGGLNIMARFYDLQSFQYNEIIEKLFEFSENVIDCCLTSFIDNGDRDSGRCIERVVNFGSINEYIE